MSKNLCLFLLMMFMFSTLTVHAEDLVSSTFQSRANVALSQGSTCKNNFFSVKLPKNMGITCAVYPDRINIKIDERIAEKIFISNNIQYEAYDNILGSNNNNGYVVAQKIPSTDHEELIGEEKNNYEKYYDLLSVINYTFESDVYLSSNLKSENSCKNELIMFDIESDLKNQIGCKQESDNSFYYFYSSPGMISNEGLFLLHKEPIRYPIKKTDIILKGEGDYLWIISFVLPKLNHYADDYLLTYISLIQKGAILVK